MVFVDLPEVGATVSAGDDCAVAESVKAASDIYAPVSGEIVAVNDALSDSPELVNSEPYAGGWKFHLADYQVLLPLTPSNPPKTGLVWRLPPDISCAS